MVKVPVAQCHILIMAFIKKRKTTIKCQGVFTSDGRRPDKGKTIKIQFPAKPTDEVDSRASLGLKTLFS